MRAIDADALKEDLTRFYDNEVTARKLIDEQPTIQPEPHEIGYKECANALLKMWMDNVLTDGEYYRIADKLNEKWGVTI
jgi:hypothetical protein